MKFIHKEGHRIILNNSNTFKFKLYFAYFDIEWLKNITLITP